MNWTPVLNTVGYSLLGLALMVGAFVLVDRFTPGQLWKEIIDKQNSALAILAAGFAIAVGIIIASAIH